MLQVFEPEKFIEEKISWLRRTIGSEKALAATSGGVDSMTTAALGHRAIGNRLTVAFLDDGLMRKGEPQEVVSICKQLGMNVKLYEVRENFFKTLKGKVDPEEKRKAFREAFYHTLSEIARDLRVEHLLQGTIAADVVETRSGVKTQHNVLEQVGINPLKKYGYKILEPIKDLYKPQVREVAESLGLSPEVTKRRPFPGPGLAVRVIGKVTPERVELVREATAIVEEETRDILCFQAFAVLMQDRATGVTKAKKRKYGEIIVIRAVQSEDAMTAEPVALPWEAMRRIERKITEKLPTVTRVLYDLSSKPPATIEFE